MVVLSSFAPPTEGIKHEQPSTVFVMNGRELGAGTLYIAESQLSWRNNATGEGFSLLYPTITIHAISKDVERFGSECLYIMVDAHLDEQDENEDLEEDEREIEQVTEIRFVPEDKTQLDAMYGAMTFCQSQHPDPESELLSEDEEYLDADEEAESSLAGGDSVYIDGHPVLDRTNGWRNGDDDIDNEGQFEDAEDD